MNHPEAWPEAAEKQARYHADVVDAVRAAVASHRVVVIGMGWNPNVARARKALDKAGIAHHYVQYGNYTNMWRQRLAIKLWSRWPTFPQVFVGGALVGGADETEAAIAAGRLAP